MVSQFRLPRLLAAKFQSSFGECGGRSVAEFCYSKLLVEKGVRVECQRVSEWQFFLVAEIGVSNASLRMLTVRRLRTSDGCPNGFMKSHNAE